MQYDPVKLRTIRSGLLLGAYGFEDTVNYAKPERRLRPTERLNRSITMAFLPRT